MGGSSSTDCGTNKEHLPTLGIYVEDNTNSGTDAKILGRVHTGNGDWSSWKKLGHSDCDDHEKGKKDFHDVFEDITDSWEAVALYNCGTDGLEIGGIQYWDGSSNQRLEYFCDNVAGPSVSCYSGQVHPAQGECYKSASDNYYDGVWIDQDQSACPAINVAVSGTLTGNKKAKKVNVGKIYYKSNPGVPDCDALYTDNIFAVSSHGEVTMFNQTASMEMVMILLAMVMLFVFLFRKCYNHWKHGGYEKLSSLQEECEPLNNRSRV